MAKKYKVISLFSGCGGMDLGFLGGFTYLGKKYSKRNFDIIWANDIDYNACVTYEKNLGHRCICANIDEILYQEDRLFPKFELPAKADIVLGGFPCQDFSLAGKRRGFDSARGNLYKSMVEVIKRTNPKIFIAENVKGLLTIHNGEAIKKIKKDFEALGYSVHIHLLHSAYYGVPQSRERVIIVGTSKDSPDFPLPKQILQKDDWIMLNEALCDLENLKEGEAANHFWSKAKLCPGKQGNSSVSPDKIGPTMRSEHHGNIEYHWNKKRRLSAREAARIQSFPDDFIFYPSTSAAYKQIGNAVPPVMAWHIAGAVEDFLNEEYTVVHESERISKQLLVGSV
ncbi:MAG: DNA cytosine methyltransferase [Patescibacteria group bacterium]